MISRSGETDQAPRRYSIRVGGHLGPDWSEWFDGLSIRCHDDGTTTLVGSIQDQAALYGALLKIRDLGLRLIAVVPQVSEEVRDPGGRGEAELDKEEERGEDG